MLLTVLTVRSGKSADEIVSLCGVFEAALEFVLWPPEKRQLRDDNE